MQSSAPPSGRQGRFRKFIKIQKKIRDGRNKVMGAAFCFVAPFHLTDTNPPVLGNSTFDLVTEEETGEVFVYKMDRPQLQANQLRVEIRQGNALWVISQRGQRDKPTKVKLRRNHEMRLNEATASLRADGVLTIVIPKRDGSQKWYEYMDLAFNMFKTFRVEISQC